MSASESPSGATNLHASIEQLIAETVRQSRSGQEAEKQKLTGALKSALAEVESSQQALGRAAATLRDALGAEGTPALDVASVEVTTPSPAPESHLDIVHPVAEPLEAGPTSTPASDRGPHEMDVIAHNVNITQATGLQSWLRGREEVTNAQIREFVAGELRLHLELGTGLQMDAFKQWLGDHHGEIVTSTDKVLEIRFADAI